MTVAELIARLSTLPGHLPVYWGDRYEDYDLDIVDVVESPIQEEFTDNLGRGRKRHKRPIVLEPVAVHLR